MNYFIESEYILVVRYYEPMAILKDMLVIGEIYFKAKFNECKNRSPILGRYEQHVGHSVFAVDNDARLYRIKWQDIKDGKYHKTLVKEKVENFYVDVRLGLATINTNNTLSFETGPEVDLKAKVDTIPTWTILTPISECWIVCGDIDGYAIMVSVTEKGYVRSTLKFKLTSNGYDHGRGIEFAGIYSLHQAYVRGRRSIILAIERDGCCYLISVAYGIISKLQSIDSIVSVGVS